MLTPRKLAVVPEVEVAEARSSLNRVLDEELPEAEMREIIRTLRDKAKAGDLPAARVLEKFMSQGKGTPKQTVGIEMSMKVSAARTFEELDALSSEELALVAAGAGAAVKALPAGS